MPQRSPSVEPLASEARQSAPARRRLGLAPFVAGAALVLLAAGALYWTTARPSGASFLAQKITRGPIVRTVTTSGTVSPIITVQVGAYVSGVIVARYCDYNTEVKKPS